MPNSSKDNNTKPIVKLTISLTIRPAEYESIHVSAGIEVPCDLDAMDETYKEQERKLIKQAHKTGLKLYKNYHKGIGRTLSKVLTKDRE